MRASLSVLAFLSALTSIALALPQSQLLPRAPEAASPSKPKYSVVPLEPDESDPSSQDGGNGNGGKDGKGSVGGKTPDDHTVTETETETIVKTELPVTQTITKEQHFTITESTVATSSAAPEHHIISSVTVTVINEVTTTVMSSAPASKSSPSSLWDSPVSQTASIPGTCEGLSTEVASKPPPAQPSVWNPPSLNTIVVTSTTTKATYDDGLWHTVYPAWNQTAARRFRH